ncbi:MAG: hypothetical protein WBB23_15445 [Desulforhopalus sp.]
MKSRSAIITTSAIATVFSLLIFSMPLIGVFLSGRPVEAFLSFPPLTIYTGHHPFSWMVFLLYLFLTVGTLALIAAAAYHRPDGLNPVSSERKRKLPWWGWIALAVLALSWFLAWTRFSWFEAFQRLTFIPLWFSYIMIVNALCVRRTGTCPMLDTPIFFVALFPLSAVFWWFFEYLNQFVQNWFYTGVDYGPLAYSLHASISFSTVLPAVYSTCTWISTIEGFQSRFHGLPALNNLPSKLISVLVLLFACAGLVGVSLRPEELFALLWLAPLLILVPLKHLAGKTTLFSAIAQGDWRPAISAALAALLCGFFWEMWNYHSLAKWIYSIPYVERFKIFEMPLLGYMGYLPFGLLCIEVSELFKDCFSQNGQGGMNRKT